MRKLALISLALLAGCGGGERPGPGIKVEYVDRFVEVSKPCPVTKPDKPAPLARPLPNTAAQLIDVLTAKLTEWAGDGGYGDKADAAIGVCIKDK